LVKSSPHSLRYVLVITNDSRDAKVIRESLAGAGLESFRVEWVCLLSVAIDRLKRLKVATVILDLSLPDSHGIETFEKVSMAAPRVPILILSGTEDDETVKQAMRRGAQDYLPKSHLNSYSLPRAVQTVIALKIAAEALLSDRERAEATLNSIGDAVLSTDMRGRITYLNAVAERMTGWGREDAYGRPLADVFQIIHKASGEPVRNPLEFAVQQDQTVSLTKNTLLVRRDGLESAIEDSAAPIRDREGRVVGAVIVFRDVGESQSLARKLTLASQHDALTELPNRLLLNDRLTQAITMAQRHRNKVAVLFVDVDNFKSINDSLGHAIGDAVLQAIAKRLRETVRETDTVSRQGGDEFLILLPEADRANHAVLVAERLLSALATPHKLGDRELVVAASIGISLYPDHGRDAEGVVQSADIAMYNAKKSGGNNYRVFA
jgi:diguanylate cyclase (GGDEF)-like protein/PAS domain S-box-containing protein